MASSKAKTTITIDKELLAMVRAAVSAGGAASVSAYIEHSVRGQLAAETEFDAIIEEILASTGGPPTPAEQAAAQSVLTNSA